MRKPCTSYSRSSRRVPTGVTITAVFIVTNMVSRSHVRTMGSCKSKAALQQGLSERSADELVESTADRIGRNDKYLTWFVIDDWSLNGMNVIEELDALRNNSVVWHVFIYEESDNLLQVNQEALAKLSEVMTCNKSVESLTIRLESGSLVREILFATMATSGGWSSIQVLDLHNSNSDNIAPLSLREAEHISNFIMQSENLRTLRLV